MANENTPTQKQSQTQYPTTPSRKKKNTKNTRPQVGGTAISGARSTQPRTVESSNPQQQQYENSNRDMRRRMERIGTAPDEENKMQEAQKKRQKQIERRKERLDSRRAELSRQMPSFNRRNLYFFLGTLAIIIILIVAFVLLRANHILG
jgi:hypothetical protein